MIPGVRTFAGLLLLAICSTVQAQTRQAAQSSSPAAKEVGADGCLDRKVGRFELTNAFDWVVYYLTGQTAGLENHIGDELKVRGIETSPGKPSAASLPQDRVPPTLRVTGIEVLTHKNPEGVRPILGSLASWVSYDNPEYGVRLRYPSTFTQGQQSYPPWPSNFAGEVGGAGNLVIAVRIPKTTYPDSNYVDGNFSLFVGPKIDNEGTCTQFRTFWPEHTGSTTVNGVSYSRTIGGDGVAAGTASSDYDFHTFQNGLCYEFSFNFAESNGGGMDVPCSMQWVSENNEFELMRAVLAQVSFAKPLFQAAGHLESKQKIVPSVISFEHGPIPPPPRPGSIPMATGVSWKTANADYVQIRYPCIKSLFASTVQPSSGYGLGQCGDQTDTNLPPNGSMGLLVNNFNPTPVELVLTLEPFRDGVGYPRGSKSISISALPHAPLHQNEKPYQPPAPQPQERTFSGCLQKVAGTNAYWLLPSGVSWQVALKSDTVDLSAYANQTVKVTAVRKDMQPYWIATSVTKLSDSCETDK
jgi:hypothetical protein